MGSEYFDEFDKDPDLWHYAPRLRGPWGVGCSEENLKAMNFANVSCPLIRQGYQYMGSDACWIARPYTPLTEEAYRIINGTLNRLWADLLAAPVPARYKGRCCSVWAQKDLWFDPATGHYWPGWRHDKMGPFPNGTKNYPIAWFDVAGNAWDPLQLKWGAHVRLGLPRYDDNLPYL